MIGNEAAVNHVDAIAAPVKPLKSVSVFQIEQAIMTALRALRGVGQGCDVGGRRPSWTAISLVEKAG